MGLNDMGNTGAGTNVTKNGGSSSPKTPSGSGSTNKDMGSNGAGNNVGSKGGSLNTK